MMSQSHCNILVWDSEGHPPEGDFTIVFWRAFLPFGSARSISIPAKIEENAELYRARYLAWIYELGERSIHGRRLIDHLKIRQDFSYWWMTALVEKCNYSKSPMITDAIRLFAFDEWAKDFSDIKLIKLVSANRELQDLLKHWCDTQNICFEWKKVPSKAKHKSPFKGIFDRLPHTIQAGVWLLKHLIERWPLSGVGVTEWKKEKRQVTFISYLFNLKPDAARAGYFESYYWTDLPGVLDHEKIRSNWLHIYVKNPVAPDAKAAAKLLQSFNTTHKGKQAHIALDSFLSVKTVAGAIRDYYRVQKFSRINIASAFKCHAGENPVMESLLWMLFKKDWERSLFGMDAIHNLLMLNLFEEAFSNLPKQSRGVYLQENQGWEFGMIQSWRACSHGQLAGFPHSTVRFWDLRYFFDSRCYVKEKLSLPMPDYEAVSGDQVKNAFEGSGYPRGAMLEVEALRFLYLNKMRDKQIRTRLVSSKRLQLLVLGDYLPESTSLQMSFLRKIAEKISNIELTVKPHPACPVNSSDYPELKFKLSNEPLSDLFRRFDVAYASSVTSAAIDAYSAGLKVISVTDPTILNLSPLRGFEEVRFVTSARELQAALNEISSQSAKDAGSADCFNVDSSLPRWRALLSEKPSCIGANQT